MKTRRIFYVILAIAVSFCSNINGQSHCLTQDVYFVDEPGQDSIYAESPPYCFKVYVHVIGSHTTLEAVSTERVKEALNILDEDFNPHDIYFIWDCNIDTINWDPWYNDADGNPEVFGANYHDDGIDIYLFPDHPEPNANGAGLANTVSPDGGGDAFYVAGNSFYPPYSPLTRSRVVSHEMGHCLGLLHTHYDGICK